MAKHKLQIELSDLTAEEAARLTNKIAASIRRQTDGRFSLHLTGSPYVPIGLLRQFDRSDAFGWVTEAIPGPRASAHV